MQQGSLVDQAALQPVRVQPDGPVAGGSPTQIVRGFLRASAGVGFNDDHAIARSFFARGVRDRWLPDAGVKVYSAESSLKVELLTPATVRVTAPMVAEVDSAGRYQDMPPGTMAQVTFGMHRLGEGWRISQPPSGFGLWLSASDLDRSYRSFTVAYASKVSQSLVVDRRWFPVTPGLATTLARAQLAPVPRYLSGAARTGVPPGTTLAVDSVPVQSGQAVVDLSASALLATPDMRRAMWAQFVTTLSQVSSVSQLSLEVKGAGLDLTDAPSRVSTAAELGYQPRSPTAETAILRVGGDLSRVATDRPSEQDQPRRPPSPPASSRLPKVPASWVSLALSWNGDEVAGISAGHSDLARWQWNRHLQLPRFGTGLTKPSYDSMDGLWVAGRAGRASKVWVVDTSVSPMGKAAKPREIEAPWLANRTVLALKVAADNQRVALVTSDRGGRDVRLLVAGVVRAASGAPISLAAEPLRVGSPLTAVTDLAWVDDSTLAVVGRVGGRRAVGPQLVEIGGKVTAMPPVAGTRSVTNTGGLRGVVVLTDRGQVLARAGMNWQVLQAGTDFLIPGE